MSDEPIEEMSIREEVEADFPTSISAEIAKNIGYKSDPQFLHSDIIRNLIRYELEKERQRVMTKSAQRKSLMKLHGSARQFLNALDNLPVDILKIVRGNLKALTEQKRWEGWTFETNQPIPADDDSLALARACLRNVAAACELELDILEETKGQSKGSRAPALDYLIVNLALLFESNTDLSATSQCYRDQTSEDDYNGKFYNMVKMVMDFYAPRSYGTSAGLGIRIIRTLRSLDCPNT